MKYFGANEINRRVRERPEYPQLRAVAEEAWAAKLAADARFFEAQREVSALYDQELVRLLEEADDDT